MASEKKAQKFSLKYHESKERGKPDTAEIKLKIAGSAGWDKGNVITPEQIAQFLSEQQKRKFSPCQNMNFRVREVTQKTKKKKVMVGGKKHKVNTIISSTYRLIGKEQPKALRFHREDEPGRKKAGSTA